MAVKKKSKMGRPKMTDAEKKTARMQREATEQSGESESPDQEEEETASEEPERPQRQRVSASQLKTELIRRTRQRDFARRKCELLTELLGLGADEE